MELPKGASRGAVNVLESALAKQSKMPIHVIPAADIPTFLRAVQLPDRIVIFTQQEGSLSQEYFEWASVCLAEGATIVELNVFNLPSPWRPDHNRYHMALYAREGASRLTLRSNGAGWWSPKRYVPLPNVTQLVDPVQTSRTRQHGELRLLRIGRPDAVKWSDWEIRVASCLAMARPHCEILLTLVGVPQSLTISVSLPKNLEVICEPYSDNVSDIYRRHDVYIHYSKIGETFGNTFAEAQVAGLSIVGAFDTNWDMAPVEFLDRSISVLGSPRWLLRNPHQLWRLLDVALSRAQLSKGSKPIITPVEYLDRLVHPDTYSENMPKFWEAVLETVRTSRSLEGVHVGLRSGSQEILRGARLRHRGRGATGC